MADSNSFIVLIATNFRSAADWSTICIALCEGNNASLHYEVLDNHKQNLLKVPDVHSSFLSMMASNLG